ncbi:hypothetical protein QBC34DRAFT_140084 [Podospora aff. communis PSN243]|uniref:Apple domain-containing protein n=1 Tax=Podospora aff. communis PSN243 TaxID=3040156 RepID=A0AAV9H4D9_9PEZI|nr:hypothetical protein QBC34DRAFT_140084 [Podospora aff. communis PSN243]
MSSPSQIAEPGVRPSSGLPSSTAPGGAQGKTYKAYGQDYQFAERLSNPPPEFVIGSSIDEHSAPVAAQTDGTHENTIENGSANGQDSSFKESQRRESIWRPPLEKPWYKKVPKMWWISTGITVIGSTVVILAILAAMGTFSGHESSADSATSSSAPSPTPSASCTGASCSSTTSSAHPIPTDTVKECTNSKTFTEHVSWAGIVDADYDTVYPSSQPKSAESCCSVCYQANGCGGWMYDGDNKFTPCVYLTIKSKGGGTDPDGKCPEGHADRTSISIDSNKAAVGGLGPCSRELTKT